jgi:NTP pyrophosphatase (non-canonical NTP hydrolase)
MFDRNEFAKSNHQKIKDRGYWDTPREMGTLLMLMVTEISKLFDETRVNRNEKVADLALRIYDYCAYYNIDLTDLPEVDNCDLLHMVSALTNELEVYRAELKFAGVFVKQCLSMAYRYADQYGIDLEEEMIKKSAILNQVKKKLI